MAIPMAPGIDVPREELQREPQPAKSAIAPLLRVPLFHKLLLANAVIVVVAVAATSSIVGGPGETAGAFGTSLAIALAGIALIVVANALIVWIALAPVRDLTQAAARVRGGDLDARVHPSPLADAEMERLVVTFNDVLDTVADRSRRFREMAARVNAAVEDERRRVSAELHDGIAQTLAALNIRIRLARAATDPQLRDGVLDEVSGGIADAILELRRMARGLRPPALEMLGLAAAITSHVRSTADSSGIDMEIEADNVAGLLTSQAELSLYRILQESLSNVVRHSGASTVSVRLKRNSGVVELIVEDDGHGFDMKQSWGDDRGLGLLGMEERVAVIGGTLEIQSRLGAGTRVVAHVPVSDEVTHDG
jgi:two-component system sensor histidine kinase UhpB